MEKKSDILLLIEQYADKQSPSWFSDGTGTAAVWVFSPGKVPILGHGEGNGFVWVRSRGGHLLFLLPNAKPVYRSTGGVIVAARDVETAHLRLDTVMRRVNGWMRDHGLSLALIKTEIGVLTKKRIQTIITMRVGDLEIETKLTAKYLGVEIDSFGEQIRGTTEKAGRGVASLGTLMANVCGPLFSIRRLLMSSVNPALLYGVEVWGQALTKKCYKNRLPYTALYPSQPSW